MDSFQHLRNKFVGLYARVKEIHASAALLNHGHGLDHDVTVAQIATLILEDPALQEQVWIAGMLHSLDRVVDSENLESTLREIVDMVPPEYLTLAERATIQEAVLRHSELNQSDQSMVQQVLMDADRLANLMTSIFIRAGQFLPYLPALDFSYLSDRSDPAATYHDPKSVLDNIRANMHEYLPQLRLEKAKKMGEQSAKQLASIIAHIHEEHQALGLTNIAM